MHGIYHKAIVKNMEKYIKSTHHYKISDFFEIYQLNYHKLVVNEKNVKAFTNINTPDDYKRIINNEKD